MRSRSSRSSSIGKAWRRILKQVMKSFLVNMIVSPKMTRGNPNAAIIQFLLTKCGVSRFAMLNRRSMKKWRKTLCMFSEWLENCNWFDGLPTKTVFSSVVLRASMRWSFPNLAVNPRNYSERIEQPLFSVSGGAKKA